MSAAPGDRDDARIRHEVKRELRKRMRALRGALPASACDARSNEIAKRVVDLGSFVEAAAVLSFAPIRREVRTHQIMDAAWRAQKRVALPRVSGDDLELLLIERETPLAEGALGVPEPPPHATPIDPDEIDFALVPALAIDPRGHRIGYGGGYYDRLLPTLARARFCALAFDFQLIAEVPELALDAPVDIVVTDARVIEVG